MTTDDSDEAGHEEILLLTICCLLTVCRYTSIVVLHTRCSYTIHDAHTRYTIHDAHSQYKIQDTQYTIHDAHTRYTIHDAHTRYTIHDADTRYTIHDLRGLGVLEVVSCILHPASFILHHLTCALPSATANWIKSAAARSGASEVMPPITSTTSTSPSLALKRPTEECWCITSGTTSAH